MHPLQIALSIVLFSYLCVAKGFSAKSGPLQATLIELYTSEGCSSCPPADAYFAKLRKHPKLWKAFIPMGFHVDYWDHLGWKDKQGSKDYSIRQRNYIRFWGKGPPYTPEFVVDGKEWRGWHRKATPELSNVKTGILTVTSTDLKRFELVFAPTIQGTSWIANLAVLESNIKSSVTAGENSGRALEHHFVVQNLQKAPLKKKNKQRFEGNIQIGSAAGKNRSIVAWITKPRSPTPIQAAGGDL